MVLDIEIYDAKNDACAQATYLVHGYDDVLWTDSIDDALQFLRESLERIYTDQRQIIAKRCTKQIV